MSVKKDKKIYSNLKFRSGLSAYISEIDTIPLLTKEQEEFYAQTYASCCQASFKERRIDHLCSSCAVAKHNLIVSNLRFVVSIAKKYHCHRIPLADLINEGNIGLMTAVDKFDYSKGFRFISYAVWWIRQTILKAVSEKSRMVRIPANRSGELSHIRHFQDDFKSKNGRPPTHAEIGEWFGLDEAKVRQILMLNENCHSLDEFCDNEIDIPASNTPESASKKKFLSEEVKKLVNQLPKREQIIIIQRYGLDGEECRSLSQIGDLLHLTKERIRQLEKQAVDSLRKIAIEQETALFL
ncbi:MAG: sigma-70 family RNA polymerase sigma factor [Brevinema sp.]